MWVLNFLHTYQPQPILLQIGPVKVYWYGLLIVIGILAAWFVTIRLLNIKGQTYEKRKFNRSDLYNLGFYLIVFGIIGARLYHVFSELPYYFQNPLQIFMIWQGGLGIYGAVVAGTLVLFFYAKKHGFSFLFLGDVLAPGVILAQAIGRWGNYFNSEVFGFPTNMAWGIPIGFSQRPIEFLSAQYFHPTFLYESLWNLFVFVVLLLVFNLIFKNYGHRGSIVGGRVFGLYLILYSLGRFLIEFIRIDPQHMLFGLRLAQIVAIVVFVAGWAIIVNSRLKTQSAKQF